MPERPLRAEHEPVPTVTITIDGRPVVAESGSSVLEAALTAGLYIPHLCHHPSLVGPLCHPEERSDEGSRRAWRTSSAFVYRAAERVDGTAGTAFDGCGLCVVRVEGEAEPRRACELPVATGLVVRTQSPELQALRRSRLARILATHPHACLTCAQKEGCSRASCSSNVPEAERCCPLLGHCELEKVACHIGIPPETPRYIPRSLPAATGDPLFAWQPELCVSCLRCVRACTELKGAGALGWVVRGGDVVVGLVAPGRDEAGCRYCGACVELCPTGALTDRPATGADRAARLVPCRHSCPAGMDVPRFLRAVAGDRIEEAARIVADRIPLPESLGRVCFHPCEQDCRRSELGGALSVCRLRRHVFDALGPGAVDWPAAPERGGRVAVIGAGPAGLAAAHFLRRLGRSVTVFEAAPEAGGMLRYGIPAYRLPLAALQRDLERLRAQGVELRTGTAFGRDLTLDVLGREGFEAVLLAVGIGAAKALPGGGAMPEGVLQGVELLRGVATGESAATAFAGQRVLVIGGGNVAVDAARSAVRLGAAAVTLACLESAGEMPAYAPEVAAAQAEGVELLTSWGVGELLAGGARVRGASLVRCVSVFDEAGRFAPRFDASITREAPADTVIVAIGQELERGFLAGCDGTLQLDSRNLLSAELGTMGAGLPAVFACGDASLGPSSVVRSVASGRAAAEAIDRFLGGNGEVPSILEPERPAQWLGRDEGFAGRARFASLDRAVEMRRHSFDEVDLGLPASDAGREAGRCLQCDLRLCLGEPTLPPLPWRELSAAEVAKVPPTGGAYQLIGADRVATKIAGAPDLRAALEGELRREPRAPYFSFDEDPMYTKRESELIQAFLGQHGRMPAADSDLDELF